MRLTACCQRTSNVTIDQYHPDVVEGADPGGNRDTVGRRSALPRARQDLKSDGYREGSPPQSRQGD